MKRNLFHIRPKSSSVKNCKFCEKICYDCGDMELWIVFPCTPCRAVGNGKAPTLRCSDGTHAVFLYGDVGQMNEHVVQLRDAGVVLHRAEPTEAKTISAQSDSVTSTASTLPVTP